MESLRRFDERVARAEGALAVVVLLGMVLVASLQALFFNIAERDVGWARTLLEGMSWADAFLQKGTLWIAFLGASLATHSDKHIAVDLLPRLASPRLSAVFRAIASFGAGIVAIVLARVYFHACLIADASIPFDYEALTPTGQMHVCDAPADIAAELGRPGVLCALRSALGAIHVPVASGEGVAQLITPVMFVVIAIRLFARSAGLAFALSRGEVPQPPHALKPTDPATLDTPTKDDEAAGDGKDDASDGEDDAKPADDEKPVDDEKPSGDDEPAGNAKGDRPANGGEPSSGERKRKD